MGYFLRCFRVPTKIKLQNSAERVLPGNSKIDSHECLDSLFSQENFVPSDSQLSDKFKERTSIKTEKKHGFDLNVQMYDPILDEETTVYRLLQREENEIDYRYIIQKESCDDYLVVIRILKNMTILNR